MAQYGEDDIISKCDSGLNAGLLGWNNMIEKKNIFKNTLVTMTTSQHSYFSSVDRLCFLEELF